MRKLVVALAAAAVAAPAPFSAAVLSVDQA